MLEKMSPKLFNENAFKIYTSQIKSTQNKTNQILFQIIPLHSCSSMSPCPEFSLFLKSRKYFHNFGDRTFIEMRIYIVRH